MDLHLNGKTAMVCGARTGLGHACAAALAAEGVALTLLSRDAAGLAAAAAGLAGTHGVPVRPVAGDLADPAARAALIAACPAPDILILNAGGPPPGDATRFAEADWTAALAAGVAAQISLVNAVLPGMRARRFGRIVVISSGALKAPLPFLALSNAARAGLWSALKGLSRQVAAEGVTINALLPHAFETDRLASNFANRARQSDADAGQLRAASLAAIPAGRFGQPEEFAIMCATLCHARLGYLTGQAILLDGGHFTGVL